MIDHVALTDYDNGPDSPTNSRRVEVALDRPGFVSLVVVESDAPGSLKQTVETKGQMVISWQDLKHAMALLEGSRMQTELE